MVLWFPFVSIPSWGVQLFVLLTSLWCSSVGAYTVNGISYNASQCVGTNLSALSGGAPDLFPTKLYPYYSTTWNVEYHNTYKVVWAGCSGNRTGCAQKLILYQCGTPKPTGYESDNVTFVQIPLRKVAIGSMPIGAFLEVLGERLSILGLMSDEYVSSPCLRKLMQQGDIEKIPNEYGYDLNYSMITHERGYDAVFSSGYGMGPNYPPLLILAWEYMEKHYLGVMEYLYFLALFYNRELVVKSYVKELGVNVKCHQGYITTYPIQKVFWAQYSTDAYYGGWTQVPSCPNWYCDLVTDARGSLLTGWKAYYNKSAGIVDQSIIDALQSADVWIFPGAWDSVVNSTLSALTWVTNSSVWRNKRIFAADGNDMDDWFEGRPAQPDVVLEDFISALFGSVHTGHTRIWLRNVFNETAKTKPPASQCRNPEAPMVLYDDYCPPPPGTAAPTCKKISDLYDDSQDFCETLFGQSYRYEPVMDKAYTMAPFTGSVNPNDQISSTIGFLTSTQTSQFCWFSNQKTSPSAEANMTLCSSYSSKSCCYASQMRSADQIEARYGTGLRWDRCGALSDSCAQFFLQQECFHSCDPNVGFFMKYGDSTNPKYNIDIYRMPIRADYCDAWFQACKNDKFCADATGDFKTCPVLPVSSPLPNAASIPRAFSWLLTTCFIAFWIIMGLAN